MAPKPNAFDDFFDDDGTPDVVDTKPEGRLLRVPLGRISPNCVNPRTQFGTPEELVDFGKSLKRRQIHACPVVTRKAYLDLWPDHKKKIGNVDVVIVSGERRYRSGQAVDLPALDCVINDAVATSRKKFMEAVVSENVDRANFDAVEEAYAVEALVREFGSNRAVAQHFERVDGWVTQRILLTHLDPQMQTLVRHKEIPLEAARTLGKLTRDHEWDSQQQAEWWEKEQEQRQSAAAARKAAKKLPPPSPPAPSAPEPAEQESPKPAPVPHQKTEQKTEEAPAPQPLPIPAAVPAEPTPVASSAPERVVQPPHHEPAPEHPGESEPEPLPELVTADAVRWGDPEAVYQLIQKWMRPENIAALGKLIHDGDS